MLACAEINGLGSVVKSVYKKGLMQLGSVVLTHSCIVRILALAATS